MVLAVLLTACNACGPAESVDRVSPSPSLASPTVAVASPSASATTGCHLPVAGLPPDANDPARRDVGFVSFPGGNLSLAADAITYARDTGLFRTTSQPYLFGQDAEAYDSVAGRWIPTTYLLIAPDGSAYAYQAPGTLDQATQSYGPSSIHLVDVATAVDRQDGPAMGSYPIAFLAQGVLVVTSTDTGPGSNGVDTLWLLEPGQSAATKVSSGTIGWDFATGGYVYGTDLNPADPSPLVMSPMEPGISRAPDRAWRLDIQSGNATPWLYRPGKLVEVAGIDGDGRLIVIVTGFDKTEVWALTAPETGEKIYDGPGQGPNDILGLGSFVFAHPGITDANGFWFGTSTGIVLYTRAGFKLVYEGQASPAGVCA
jgi:hypothetical protein